MIKVLDAISIRFMESCVAMVAFGFKTVMWTKLTSAPVSIRNYVGPFNSGSMSFIREAGSRPRILHDDSIFP